MTAAPSAMCTIWRFPRPHAPHKAAALVWVNQLMSAKAQAAKADPLTLG